MVPLLYLDTARLGRMSPAAQRASQDFAAFAGDVGAAIQFDRFLRHGLAAGIAADCKRYPGLADWHGVTSLKTSLARLVKLEPQLPVLIASRTSQLMKFAAIVLRRRCRNVLITDLGWPDYHRILSGEFWRANQRLTAVSLHDEMISGRLCKEEVVEQIKTEYIENGCDGLFLSAVSNLGIRLPVREIHEAISRTHRIWFTVIDGAQDFRHTPSDFSTDCCDLYIAGCHKWLSAYQPLGLAFYGRHRTRQLIESMLAECLDTWELDDPLLRYIEGLNAAGSRGDETVNLSALFSCQGAVSDALRSEAVVADEMAVRRRNSARVAGLAEESGWSPQQPHASLRSGVLLLQANRCNTRRQAPETIREAFYERGIALSAYEDGLVRVSMPAVSLSSDELALIDGALRHVA